MILYLIQVHRYPRQVIQLIDLLRHPETKLIINVDPAAAFDRQAVERHIRDSGITGAVRVGMPLTWGGISQVFAQLDLFQFALRWDQDWRYAISLSGECIPLVSQQRIRSFLSEREKLGQRAHLSFFGPAVKPSLYHCMRFGEALGPVTAVADSSFYDRVSALMQASVQEVFNDPDLNPLFNWFLRGSLHVTDLTISKRLVMRRLLPFEASRREAFFGHAPLWGGRAWYLFRRDAVEDILKDRSLADYLAEFEHYLCADELCMQTVIMNSNRFSEEEISCQNVHFRQGEPIVITDDLTDQLFESGAFFARKINYDLCPGILDRVRHAALFS